MLDTSLRQHKRDPKCNHGHGIGARPTMPQVRQIAPCDSPGEVDAKLKREKKYLFFLFLLMLLLPRSRG